MNERRIRIGQQIAEFKGTEAFDELKRRINARLEQVQRENITVTAEMTFDQVIRNTAEYQTLGHVLAMFDGLIREGKEEFEREQG